MSKEAGGGGLCSLSGGARGTVPGRRASWPYLRATCPPKLQCPGRAENSFPWKDRKEGLKADIWTRLGRGRKERVTWKHTLLLLSHFCCVGPCDPIDGSPAGSSVPGILLARTLEWVAISFLGTYITIYKIDSQWDFAMTQGTHTGAL